MIRQISADIAAPGYFLSLYLLVELDVGEYGVYTPRFREHGAEG